MTPSLPALMLGLLALTALCPCANAIELVAFHGVSQSLRDAVVLDPDDCSATRIKKEEHGYFENTIPSLKAAFDLGATICQFDARRTSDGEVVAFYDRKLECKTDESGMTVEQTLAHLKKLDVAFGYTYDSGQMFPFRGKGVGLIPTLQEILTAFPDRRFVINDRDNQPETITAIARALSGKPEGVARNLFYMGGQAAEVRRQLPAMQIVAAPAETLTCASWWFFTRFFGYVHPTCKDTTHVLSMSDARKFESWVPRFVTFLRAAGSKTWIVGVRTEDDAALAKSLDPDGIGTFEIARLSGALK